jgi:hypothetical protein
MAVPFTTSPSGVQLVENFRDNLIVDRYDPVFVRMRAQKLKHLCSENSEDAVTWNVFRSLRHADPQLWLPYLTQEAKLGDELSPDSAPVTVSLWQLVPPPRGLLRSGDEGESEVDIIIESPDWVWFIEAKYGSDISVGTTTRPQRDQLLRNIDVGSYYAGTRHFCFSLLYRDAASTPEGLRRIAEYQDFSRLRQVLAPHRLDNLQNLRAITSLTWLSFWPIFERIGRVAAHSDERFHADQARAWLTRKRLSKETVQ